MSQPHRRFFEFPWRSARRIQADVDEELGFELDMRTAELVQQGMSSSDARRQAISEFGDFDETRRLCAELDADGQRSARQTEWLADLRQDARLAWRGMRRAPAFALVVVATLALGIGANTAVFSAVRKVLLDRLPYRDPDHLVRLFGGAATDPDPRGMLTAAEIAGVKQAPAFDAVAAFGNFGGDNYVGSDGAEIWSSVQVGPQYFRVLGTGALLGRTIEARDAAAGAEPVAVLSYGLWQRAFGGDSAIVGREIQLNGHGCTVIGVLSPSFVSPSRNPEIWRPLDLESVLRNPARARQQRVYRAIGRVAAGVTPARLRSGLELIASLSRERYPELPDMAPVNPVPLRETIVGDVRPVLLVVMGAAALVLLLACVNVAGLFLSRATARRRELAVRVALGAGRARLVRQLLTESGILAVTGGLAGVGVAFWAKGVLIRVAGGVLPPVGEIRIDAGVLGFAIAISLLSALLFGIAPALAATRFDLHGSLAESSRGASGGRSRTRAGRRVAMAQLALAVVLLIGAALLGRTLLILQRTGVGFRVGPDELTFRTAPSNRFPGAEGQLLFLNTVADAVRQLPGVRAVGIVSIEPWNGPNTEAFAIAGRPEPARGSEHAAHFDAVSPDYFDALDIPVRQGRAFTAVDRQAAPLVALVSESVARQYWPGESPVGQRIRLGDRGSPEREVVGVVGDVRWGSGASVDPTIYVPIEQSGGGGGAFVVRTTGEATLLVPAIRRVLHEIDPALPLIGARTTEELFDSSLAGQRLPMLFTTAFALLALLLATLGVYSVLAYSVTTRQREFGIRSALGAGRGNVLALVVRQGMTMALAGTAAGLLVAWVASHLLGGLLVGVTPHDPVTFAAVPLLLLAVCGAACLIPARRATRVDPREALQAE